MGLRSAPDPPAFPDDAGGPCHPEVLGRALPYPFPGKPAPPLLPGGLAANFAAMILLRHGQSEFNLHFTANRVDPGIVDPRLTPLGHEQARVAAEALASEDVRRILASPYTRALQTAAPLAERLGLPVLIQPLVRERYAFTCDVGSPISQLAADWPQHDFTAVEEEWWPSDEEPADAVAARARRFRGEMAVREDWAHTVVVSHWGFIMSMTGQSVHNGQWLRCDPTAPEPAEVSWKHG